MNKNKKQTNYTTSLDERKSRAVSDWTEGLDIFGSIGGFFSEIIVKVAVTFIIIIILFCYIQKRAYKDLKTLYKKGKELRKRRRRRQGLHKRRADIIA